MAIVYEVKVDWDAVDWQETPDYAEAIDDISDYVKHPFVLDRGKKVHLGNTPAGTLEIKLNNADKRFSPTFAASPLFGKMRPWLPVRVRGNVNGAGFITFYTGFISKITVNPHENIQEAYLYCTDGTDLLARNMVTEDKEDREPVTDGGAVDRLLDAAGWPSGKRDIETDGGDIVLSPKVTEF